MVQVLVVKRCDFEKLNRQTVYAEFCPKMSITWIFMPAEKRNWGKLHPIFIIAVSSYIHYVSHQETDFLGPFN